jgi:hypothetical protein
VGDSSGYMSTLPYKCIRVKSQVGGQYGCMGEFSRMMQTERNTVKFKQNSSKLRGFFNDKAVSCISNQVLICLYIFVVTNICTFIDTQVSRCGWGCSVRK